MRATLPFFLASLALPAAAQSSAFVEQVGNGNEALLTQTFDRSGLINQVSIRQADASLATVTQVGSGNVLAGFANGLADPTAQALQFDGSRLVLNQDGVGNQVYLEQRGGGYAEITQSGDDNLAFVLQTLGFNEAHIVQNGGAVAHVTQSGSNNVATITQSGF